jgi:hypothetical protein
MPTVNHGEKVFAVRIGSADQARFGIHGEEPWRLNVHVQRQLGTERRCPTQDPKALEELQLVLGVGFDGSGQVVKHLANEPPPFERQIPMLLCSVHGVFLHLS